MNSSQFEMIVSEIEEILKDSGAIIELNKKVKDPDTGHTRQVDILLSRNGLKTHIECRHRKKPQNVQWIEELHGRKCSLKADEIIGVSSSGFTKQAKDKAIALGITLREMKNLSRNDIEIWGIPVELELRFLQIIDLNITIEIEETKNPIKISPDDFLCRAEEEYELVTNILDNLADKLFRDESNESNESEKIEMKAQFDPNDIPKIENISLHSINVVAKIAKHIQHHNTTISKLYKPTEKSTKISAKLSILEINNWRVIESESNNTLIIDMNSLNIDKNLYLKQIQITNVKIGEKYKVQVYNLHNAKLFENINIQLKFEHPSR
jgi:hypothetical protein